MQATTGLPSSVPPATGGGGEGIQRSIKRIKVLKRSFEKTAAGAPRFRDDQMMEGEEADVDWFQEDIVVDSDHDDD